MPLYDEIEIEDFTYDPETLLYSYPCPCGDRFKVSLEDLWDGEDVANCESCNFSGFPDVRKTQYFFQKCFSDIVQIHSRLVGIPWRRREVAKITIRAPNGPPKIGKS